MARTVQRIVFVLEEPIGLPLGEKLEADFSKSFIYEEGGKTKLELTPRFHKHDLYVNAWKYATKLRRAGVELEAIEFPDNKT